MPDDKQIIYLHPEAINAYGTSDSPAAHETHFFEVDSHGKVESSCCGQFKLGKNFDTKGLKRYTEQEARDLAASAATKVCGVCVSHLHGDN